MLVEGELAHHTPDRDSLVTIGVFDGVHIGTGNFSKNLLTVPPMRLRHSGHNVPAAPRRRTGIQNQEAAVPDDIETRLGC
jgi:hypothetical protein